ncbi:MAG: asparaginase [Geminicoccaceae bacterium]
MTEPLEIQVWRGDLVESRHAVSACAVDRDGKLVLSIGDTTRPTYPRSAVKPLQALPLVESGAADRFELGSEELALACASHGGEPQHSDRVAAWLQRIGCTEADLLCGSHAPFHRPSARALRIADESPSALHNNCSGKHAGMLTLARHLDVPVADYIQPDHPVQIAIRRRLETLAGASFGPSAIDGCGIPTFPMSLETLARATAAFLDQGAAATRLIDAMTGRPELVAGSDKLDTDLMRAVPGLAVKTGAEGAYLAMHRTSGSALALKVHDGAGRAAEVALIRLLRRLGWIDAGDVEALRRYAEPEVNNVAGVTVGRISAA